jgi:hypothetical protein
MIRQVYPWTIRTTEIIPVSIVPVSVIIQLAEATAHLLDRKKSHKMEKRPLAIGERESPHALAVGRERL